MFVDQFEKHTSMNFGNFIVCINFFYENNSYYIIISSNSLKARLVFFLHCVLSEGGSITKLLQRYGPFDERIVISYSKQVLQGVAYLHQNQVIHRDIKGQPCP